MFLTRIKKSLKTLTFISFLGAVFFGSFCVGMFHHKTIHSVEKSDGYSVIGKSETCCGATYFEKATLWQSISISTFNDFRVSAALLGTFIAIIFAKSYQDRTSSQRLMVRIRWLLKGRDNFQLFSPLKLAFADGILNPKTY